MSGDKSNKELLGKLWEWLSSLHYEGKVHYFWNWYPFYQVYVHESESAPQILLLTTTSGVPVATIEGAELLGDHCRQAGDGL